MEYRLKEEYRGTTWYCKPLRMEFTLGIIEPSFYPYLFKNGFAFLFDVTKEIKNKKANDSSK